jgi:pyrimidine-nucleoside phosphorylase
MNIPELIERKREGGENTAAELEALIAGLLDGSVPPYQVSAWLMAVLFRGMTRHETAEFTRLMMESGEVLDLSDLPGVKTDKHSTGGVGDKISIPLAPAVAACGGVIPMISGRGLGHTGGTLDKLESIPGLRTDLDGAGFRRVLDAVGYSIIGANASLAPADSRLYALRDVTGTVPSVPLITASILSKKYAAGVDALVLDVKTGSGAFMRRREDAEELARTLVEVSSELGKRATALVTSMDCPLGRAVGNALEVVESVEILRGGGPPDVRELTVALGAEMLCLADGADCAEARGRVARALDDGSAHQRFLAWVEAQGGDPRSLEDPVAGLPAAPIVHTVLAPGPGWLSAVDTREVGLATNALGAGRAVVGDEVDPAVGCVFRAIRGDRVEEGQPLVDVHARTEEDAERAGRRILDALRFSEESPEPVPRVLSGGADAPDP